MTQVDVSTRAPESDAAADTATTGADSGGGAQGMGEHCVTDRPTPAGRVPEGEVRKYGETDVYVVKPREYPHAPARLLLLLTGGTGVHSTNNQLQADDFAAAGYVVVMPDLFEGDVAPNTSKGDAEGAEGADSDSMTVSAAAPLVQDGSATSFLSLFRDKAVETVKSFMIDMWLARHTEAKVLPILHQVLDVARDEFADAVSSGGGVFAAGYCFGARYVLLLARPKTAQAVAAMSTTPATPADDRDLEAGTAATPPKDHNGPLIKAGALAHATLVSPTDFEGLTAPVSMACVENDPLFPDEVRTFGEDYLSKNHIEHEVQVYPGVPHGFAVVGDYDDETIRTAQTTAFEQMLNWLNAH